MANNYLQPVNNYFDLNNGDLEDVDDDIFLSNTRSNSSTSARATSTSKLSTNPFEDDDKFNEISAQQQTYLERRREIENRTLSSTQKSLGLLYETEDVGKATAAELAKQREQLENTSRNLDEINSTLRFSQRHLNGLKSVFGSLKNYISGNRENMPASQMPTSPSGSNFGAQAQDNNAENVTAMGSTAKLPLSPTERYDNHPVSRLRDDSSSYQHRFQKQEDQKSNPFEEQLASNLEEMCGNISRLKFLASDLGTEIESQNELLDNMNYKIEDVDLKINKQNKEINKLLK